MEDDLRQRILTHSKKLADDCRGYTLDRLRHLPLFGDGEEPEVYHDMILKELSAQLEEEDDSLMLRILKTPSRSTLVTATAQMDIGAANGTWTRGVEAMVRSYARGPWYELLLRWQLELLRAAADLPAVTLASLAKAQTELGSSVWPAGNRVPSYADSWLLWFGLGLLPDYFPSLLVSSAWPATPKDSEPSVFDLDKQGVTMQWLCPLEK